MKYKIDDSLSKEVKSYMKDVINKLKKDNQKIDDVWSAGLYLIASNYDTIISTSKKINEDGMLIKDRFGSLIQHPLIKIKNDAQIQLQKLLIEFLLTKKSEIKNNDSSTENDDESPLMNFVNSSKKKIKETR